MRIWWVELAFDAKRRLSIDTSSQNVAEGCASKKRCGGHTSYDNGASRAFCPFAVEVLSQPKKIFQMSRLSKHSRNGQVLKSDSTSDEELGFVTSPCSNGQ